jgi:hypothetical protein
VSTRCDDDRDAGIEGQITVVHCHRKSTCGMTDVNGALLQVDRTTSSSRRSGAPGMGEGSRTGPVLSARAAGRRSGAL